MTLPVIGLPCCRWWLKDSQFFHLVGEKYLRAATWAGGAPILLPALGEEAPLAQWLDMVDGLLFTGSPSNIEPHHYGEARREGDFNDPERDATTLPLVRAALDAGVPLLGICRGLQEKADRSVRRDIPSAGVVRFRASRRGRGPRAGAGGRTPGRADRGARKEPEGLRLHPCFECPRHPQPG